MTEDRWRRLFSIRLRELMFERGMTENSLSTVSGLGQSAIWRYTHCTRTPSVLSALKLAYAFDIPLNDLVDFGETVDEGVFDGRALYFEIDRESKNPKS